MNIDIKLIRESFELAKPIGDQIINRFYENLFIDFPQTKDYFHNVDLPKQKEVLLNALVTTVDNLDKQESLSLFLLHLGESYLNYGINDTYYEWIGQTLIKTFSQFLGRYWNENLSQQWTEVYRFISQMLKKGAQANLNSTKEVLKSDEIDLILPEYSISEKIKIPYLTEEIKQSIQNAVKSVVMKQIKSEVQKYIKEEIHDVMKMSPEELIEKTFGT